MAWTERKLLERIALSEVQQEEHRRQLNDIRQRLATADARRNLLPQDEQFRVNPLLNGLERELDWLKALLTEDEQTIKSMHKRLEDLRRGVQTEEDAAAPAPCQGLTELAEEAASLLDHVDGRPAQPQAATQEDRQAVIRTAMNKLNLHDLGALTGVEIFMLRLCQAGLNQRRRLSLREERMKNLIDASMKVLDRQRSCGKRTGQEGAVP